MRIFYSYVLLCLHSLLFINRSLSSSVSSCNDPISCALSDVSIEINNLNISISNSTDFVINTLLCTNITVLSIPSTYLPPTSLNLGIQDAFVSCFGKYTYEQVSGQVKVLLNKLSLDLEVDLVPKNLTSVNYPWAFVVPQCFGSLVATVDLIGTGRSAPVVKKLENIIASALETTIPNITCTKLSTTLQVNATNTLETKIDPLLLLITSQPTSIQIPPYDSSYINWHQILTLIDTVFSVIKASDPSVADKFQRPLINMLINKITDNTGAFTLPVNKVLNLGGGGNITINSIIISGLNTFEDAALLSPSPLSNVAIRSRIGLGTLDLLINATVSLPPTPNYVYTEWILIEGKLVNTSLVLDTVIPVTKSSLNELYVNQLTQPGCWIDTLTVASLALETTVDTLAISQVRGSAVQLDKDAIALVDNILELVIDGYGPLLTEVINSIVGIKLQPVVNEKLQALVSELSCTHVCPSNSDYVVWADNTLVKALGHILNDVIGPVGLNTILRLITRGTGSLILNTDHAIVTLGGLASFNTLSVLQPSANSPYDLTSMIGLGTCNSQLCTPVSLTLNIVGGLNNISLPFTLPPSITSKLSGSGTEIFIALSNLNIQLETMIELSQGLLCDLRVGQLGTRGCLLSTAQMIALKSLNLQVTAAQTSIHGQPPHDSTALVQKVLSSLNSPSTLESINSKLIDIPVNSNRTCEGLSALPHPTKAPVKTTHNISASDFGSVPSSSTDSAYSYWEVPVVILCVLSAVMLLGFCCYREYKVYATPLRNSDSKAENDFADTSNSSNSICGWIYNMKWGESIIGSNKISFLTKAFVIVSLGVCFGLFILCLLDKDILTIKTSLTTQNKNTEITIYDVALPDIINDLWDSGSYLASFLGGFGYVWCYPVIVIAFLCFVLPPDVLPVSHRRNWLSFACLAAKANNVNWFFSVYFDPLFYFNVQPAPTLDVLTYWVIERGFTIYACVFFYFLGKFRLKLFFLLLFVD